jgi:type I restriction enzyme M protein
MLDARNIYRKVTRKIYDFSPEQLKNLTAIVWLYRGEKARFLGLVQEYFGLLGAEIAVIPADLETFETTLAALREKLTAFADSVKDLAAITQEQRQPLTDALAELAEGVGSYKPDRAALLADLTGFLKQNGNHPPATNTAQHTAKKAFDPLAERLRGLVKQVDLLFKLSARVGQLAQELVGAEKEAAEFYDRRAINKLIKLLEEER